MGFGGVCCLGGLLCRVVNVLHAVPSINCVRVLGDVAPLSGCSTFRSCYLYCLSSCLVVVFVFVLLLPKFCLPNLPCLILILTITQTLEFV